jgi:rubredoxin
MESAEAEYLKTIPCPVCKEHALTAVRTAKQPRTKLGVLASMLLKGQPVEITKMYQCTACGYDFKNLPEE